MLKKSQFTLMELLMVVAILAILFSMLLPSLRNAREKTRIAVELSNRKQLYTATVSFSKNNEYDLPDRDFTEYLHRLKRPPGYDLNKSLLEPYLGKPEMIRTNIMFCDSTLFAIRSPQTDWGYQEIFATLNYYQIPPMGNLIDPDFDNSNFLRAEPSNAIWSCMILYTKTFKWLGHNAPASTSPTDGASTVFMDGGAQWVRPNFYEPIWAYQGNTGYRPIR